MSVIYVLLAISIAIAIIFFVAFIVSVKKGQYDDSYTPSVRMLFEDELVKQKPSKEKQEKSLPAGKPVCDPDSSRRKQTVESRLKQTDCFTTIAMTNKIKIQPNKQE